MCVCVCVHAAGQHENEVKAVKLLKPHESPCLCVGTQRKGFWVTGVDVHTSVYLAAHHVSLYLLCFVLNGALLGGAWTDIQVLSVK